MNKRLGWMFALAVCLTVQGKVSVSAADTITDVHAVGSDSYGNEVHQYIALWGDFSPGDFFYISCYRTGLFPHRELFPGENRPEHTRQVNMEIVRTHPSPALPSCQVYKASYYPDGTIRALMAPYNFSLEATELGQIRKNGYK
jgi:hypothetical protein